MYNNGYYDSNIIPLFGLTAYKVGRSDGYQTLTRKSEYDISSTYIDMTSTKFEWAICSGSSFEPGGIIPALLNITVYSDCPVLPYVMATPAPTTAAYDGNYENYEYVYRMRLRYGNENYEYGPYLICVKREPMQSAVKLTFNDQIIVLDSITIPLNHEYAHGAPLIGDYQGAFDYALNTIGLNSVTTPIYYDDVSFPNLSNYYTGQNLTGRQTLSYILQLSGLCMFSTARALSSHSRFVIRSLISRTVDVYDVNPIQYRRGGAEGYWRNSIVIADSESISYGNANMGYTYILKGNPLVTAGNKSVCQTLIDSRVCKQIEREGFSYECPLNPTLEPGDRITLTYQDGTYEIFKRMVISRITWNGGAYMTLEEAEFEQYNKV